MTAEPEIKQGNTEQSQTNSLWSLIFVIVVGCQVGKSDYPFPSPAKDTSRHNLKQREAPCCRVMSHALGRSQRWEEIKLTADSKTNITANNNKQLDPYADLRRECGKAAP
ncbi:hypothetical protein CAOG_009884 [Capsaspora owczarzaki ATCC 30864]|uniref:Uncharacterized protein n=1 Tax=Capsaspora owczarzaki (strain ATCC 30864) TaxID=595528 RepID=A0A0D2WTW0_CAPO3|nr:hypothetical protein CAOG_009884 [Capsaspora owczarzaki ATCC 30864]